MPRLRKAIFNRQVHFITASVEEGIMLPANPLVKQLILSAMARAYKHHPIEICHYIVNGTHMHMIVIVNNPQDIPVSLPEILDFKLYLKSVSYPHEFAQIH